MSAFELPDSQFPKGLPRSAINEFIEKTYVFGQTHTLNIPTLKIEEEGQSEPFYFNESLQRR
jgi:hypothetical protein